MNWTLNRFRALALRAAIAAALGFAAAAQAQEATPTPPPADDDMDSIVDEVVVTGTRVAARTRLESLAPVDVLPRKRSPHKAPPSSPRRSRTPLPRSIFRGRRSPTAPTTSAPPPCAASRPTRRWCW